MGPVACLILQFFFAGSRKTYIKLTILYSKPDMILMTLVGISLLHFISAVFLEKGIDTETLD